MSDSPSHLAAKLAWILPLFFLVLSGNQGKVAYDLQTTRVEGTPATAELVKVELGRRVDVTYDYISIRVPLPDGGVMEKEELSLPHSLVPALTQKETLEVRVLPGASAEVVITEKIGPTPVVETQRKIAMMNAAISFGAALIFGIAIYFWGRMLKTSGDPSARGVTDPDPEHPARQINW